MISAPSETAFLYAKSVQPGKSPLAPSDEIIRTFAVSVSKDKILVSFNVV